MDEPSNPALSANLQQGCGSVLLRAGGNPRFDEFVGSEFGQPEGWPRAQRGVSIRDDASNPALSANLQQGCGNVLLRAGENPRFDEFVGNAFGQLEVGPGCREGRGSGMNRAIPLPPPLTSSTRTPHTTCARRPVPGRSAKRGRNTGGRRGC